MIEAPNIILQDFQIPFCNRSQWVFIEPFLRASLCSRNQRNESVELGCTDSLYQWMRYLGGTEKLLLLDLGITYGYTAPLGCRELIYALPYTWLWVGNDTVLHSQITNIPLKHPGTDDASTAHFIHSFSCMKFYCDPVIFYHGITMFTPTFTLGPKYCLLFFQLILQNIMHQYPIQMVPNLW